MLRLLFLLHYSSMVPLSLLAQGGLWMAIFFLTSFRLFLTLSILFYDRLYHYNSSLLRDLLGPFLRAGTGDFFRKFFSFSLSHSSHHFHLHPPGGDPSHGWWTRTHTVGALALGGVTLGITGYGVYETYLGRLAAERSPWLPNSPPWPPSRPRIFSLCKRNS